MKIIVDKMPETVKDCPFSESIPIGGYGCILKPYIEKLNCKPKCICKSVDKCDKLKESEINYENMDR